MAVRIGELLLKEKLITPEQLQQALTQQKANGGKLGYNLVKMGFVKDEEITALLSKQYGVPSINLAQFKIDLDHRQAHSHRDRAQVPDHPAQPLRQHAHDRDDGSDQRLRDGRHQVHDRLQRRAGRRVGSRDHRRDREVLPERQGRRGKRRGRRQGRQAGRGRHRQHARDGEPRPRGAAELARRRRRRRRGPRGAAGDQRRGARPAGRGRAGRAARERRADVGDSEGRQRHPHRAVREGAARPLPHRRDSLQHHGAADEVPRRDRRRASRSCRSSTSPRSGCRRTAASRSASTRAASRRRSTSASRCCRRCSARRSSCVSSTRTS